MLMLLDRLALALRQGRSAEVAALRRETRSAAEQWVRTPGRNAPPRDVLLRLFRLGVFDSPPLSGAPYAVWRLLREGDASPVAPVMPATPRVTRIAPAAPVTPNERDSVFFSLLMPVYNPVPAYLEAALASIRAQTLTAWELCVADDASTCPVVREILCRHAAQDERIRITFREKNGHISAASNTALAEARGAWCVLVDHDDVLPAGALAAVAASIGEHPDAAVLFSDEDRLDAEQDSQLDAAEAERLTSPLFKMGFDPDLFLACNIVSHLGVYRTDVVRALGGFREGLEGSQDYDLALRVLAAEGAAAFVHVPEILYHWRRHPDSTSASLEAKPYARVAALRAREDFAARTGLDAVFSPRQGSGFVDVRFAVPLPAPLLSVIVMVGDGAAEPRVFLDGCSYAKRETLLAVPDFLPGDKRRAWEKWADGRGIRLAEVPDAGAAGLNAAAAQARGKILAFVRGGDKPLDAGWADAAVGALCREGVGVAGCRAVTGEGFLVQAGYAVGYTSGDMAGDTAGAGQRQDTRATEHSDQHPAQHPVCLGHTEDVWLCPAYAGLHVRSAGYYSQAHLLRSVPAVYAAGLFCRRELLESLGGFDPSMLSLADADFCLRAWKEKRLRSVMVPGADMIAGREEILRRADGVFGTRWAQELRLGPLFQSRHLAWTPGGWKLQLRRDAFILPR